MLSTITTTMIPTYNFTILNVMKLWEIGFHNHNWISANYISLLSITVEIYYSFILSRQSLSDRITFRGYSGNVFSN